MFATLTFSRFSSNLQRAAANSRKKCACTTHIASAACTLAAVLSAWNENSGHCSSVDLVSVTDIGKKRQTDGFLRLEFMHKMV